MRPTLALSEIPAIWLESSRRVTLVIGIAALALSVVEGQPTFRSGVELVTIDVVATDRSGKPVHNLKASDFELFEDGKSQPIRTFQFIDASVAPAQALLPPGIVTNDIDPGGIFALVLDDIGYYVTETQQVRREAERFVKTMLQPHDHVVVVRSGVDSGFTLTTDRTRALEMALASAGRRDRGLRLEQPGGDTGVGDTPQEFDNRSPGSQGRQSFEVLAGVVEKLRPIPARRKAIIWFSRGGELPANFEQTIMEGLNLPLGRDDASLRSLINNARLANVAIYTIDPRGLVAPDTSGAGAPAPSQLDELGSHRDLASATGGRAIVNANDIGAALERVSVENRAYYLIGYEPAAAAANDKRPKPRKLQVRTKTPGVDLLHRSMYLPGNNAGAPVTDLIASPLPVRDLPIALAPAAVAIDRNKRGLLLPFEIGRDLRDDTVVQYSAVALDPSGKIVSRAAGKALAKNGRVVGDLALTAESKTYQVRFAAQALNPEVNGLAFATIKVPDGKSRDPECSGFVFEQPGSRDGLRLFTRQQPITISTLVSMEKLNGAIAFGLGAAGGVPQRVWPATPKPLASGLWGVSLSLKPPLPAGSLEIRVMRDDLLMADSCITQFVSR
jgi:VWFA-related protein